MGGLKKLSETDELEMGPINVFLPRPAASHLNYRERERTNLFKVERFGF